MTTDARDPEAVRLGATIKALREAYGLKREELARLTEVTRRYLQYIEDGEKRAPLPLCRKVADILSVPLAAITVADYSAARPGRQAVIASANGDAA